MQLVVRDIADPKSLERLKRLAQHFRVERPTAPATFAAGRLEIGFDEKNEKQRLDRLLTIEVFTRDGCPRCAAAKAFFQKLAPQYPGFRIETREIIRDPDARTRFESLSHEHRVLTPSLPGILVGGQFLIGYQSDAITGARIVRILQSITIRCPKAETAKPRLRVSGAGGGTGGAQPTAPLESTSTAEELPEFPLPEPGESAVEDAVEVPVFGVLRLSELGLPAFTFLIGLVDGFTRAQCGSWCFCSLSSSICRTDSRSWQ